MAEKPNVEELEKRIRALETELEEHKQTEILLREREARFRDIINHVPELLFQAVTHSDGSVTVSFINDCVYEYTGYRPEEIIKDPALLYSRILPEDIGPMNKQIQRAKETKTEFSFEHRLIDPDKGTRWIHARSIPKPLENGDVEWYGISVDITDRKHSEEAVRESEKKYHLLFEKMLSCCALHEIICDENGKPVDYRFLAVNPAFEKMTGFKADELLGRTLLDIMPDSRSSYLIETYGKVALAGEPISFYPYVKDADRHFEITAYQPKHGQFACLIQDVTKQKKMEEAIKKSKDELEEVVQKRTEELKKANEALHEKTTALEDVNTALKVLLEKREKDKDDIGERVLLNVKELLLPYIDRLKKGNLTESQASYLEILESGLQDIISPFSKKITSRYMHITPGEMQVANLVKEGKSSKEIAEMLKSTERAVVAHRSNLRKKLGLKEKANLRTYLLSMG